MAALALCLALGACDEAAEEAPHPASAPLGALPAEPPKPAGRAFANSEEGLCELANELVSTVKIGLEERRDELVRSLRLPNYKRWFTTTFGSELGAALSLEYRPQTEDIGQLIPVLADQVERGVANILCDRYVHAGDPEAVRYQRAALERMKQSVPLYSVRLIANDGFIFHLWSFVYDDGAFRFVGKMKAVATPERSGGRDLLEFR